MKTESSLVSVIMPAYNAGRYISESIRSVLAQTYPVWELLIVNDGSTDDTESCIRGFADPRIRYFSQPNRGVSAARNLAFQHMRGEFFCFLDADDRLPADSLAQRVKFFRQHEEVDMLDGVVHIMNASMDRVLGEYRPVHAGKIAHLFIRINVRFFFGPSIMLRNRGLPYHMDEGMTHAEDLWFYTELSWRQQLLIASLKKPVYEYRKAPGSAMSNLAGLEKGYRQYYEHVTRLEGVTTTELRYLRWRIRRIMFLSYLRAGQIRNALRMAGFIWPRRSGLNFMGALYLPELMQQVLFVNA